MAVSVADFVVGGLTADAAWSAPSAISLGGLGGGFELGVELTDFVLILNSHAAVESFRKGSNVTLGGNMTVAIGPLGRNVEADVSLRNAASFYTYSKSRCVLCVCVCVRVCVRACVRACVCVSPLSLFLSLHLPFGFLSFSPGLASKLSTSGLFAGISLEGSFIGERKSANRK